MTLARMILSGLFDRYPRLKIVVAHMGGGLLFALHGPARLRLAARLGGDAGGNLVIRSRNWPSIT